MFDRSGVFGVGVFDGAELVSAAVAMPALADDGRSMHNVPGLAHISSVATVPGRWGEGLATRAVRAIVSHLRRFGYARVQLWTHASNAAAQHLYEREGFAHSGRAKTDDFGEPIVHLIRDVPGVQAVYRPAARVLCVDAEERVLLMHWHDPRDGWVLWEPPGGGIEAGEEPLAAALREWREETGLSAPEVVAGPEFVARDGYWGGGRVVSDEYFFLARPGTSDSVATALTANEKAELLGSEWIPLADLDGLPDQVVPDVVPIVARLRARLVGS